jgi:hypothetical protein
LNIQAVILCPSCFTFASLCFILSVCVFSVAFPRRARTRTRYDSGRFVYNPHSSSFLPTHTTSSQLSSIIIPRTPLQRPRHKLQRQPQHVQRGHDKSAAHPYLVACRGDADHPGLCRHVTQGGGPWCGNRDGNGSSALCGLTNIFRDHPGTQWRWYAESTALIHGDSP